MSAGAPTRAQLAAMIDHTLLAPEATADDVRALCVEAVELDVYAVCVSPSLVSVAVEALAHAPVSVAAVVGFPSGAHRPSVTAFEADAAARTGADELDMVIDLGEAMTGDWQRVQAGIAAVRTAVPAPVLLKVIIESAVLGPDRIADACRAADQAGADFVKTSTGFHPAGGASVEAVAEMAATVAPRLGVKASGGIRTTEQALAMVAAGATRLGMSRSRDAASRPSAARSTRRREWTPRTRG